eukprot:451797-Prymnesium_polylepis.1
MHQVAMPYYHEDEDTTLPRVERSGGGRAATGGATTRDLTRALDVTPGTLKPYVPFQDITCQEPVASVLFLFDKLGTPDVSQGLLLGGGTCVRTAAGHSTPPNDCGGV